MSFCYNAVGKALAIGLLTISSGAAYAQSVLRVDDVAPGLIDPHASQTRTATMLAWNLYDTLVNSAVGEAGVAPHLAENWTFEGNSIIFKLRDDVIFESGNPLTAEDVKFSLERQIGLGTGVAFLFSQVTAVEVVDPLTVKIELEQVSPGFLSSLQRLAIVDSKLVKENTVDDGSEHGDWGQAFLSTQSAGSGAYTVARHNAQQETVLERTDNYFGFVSEKAPEQVRVRYGMEPSTVRLLMAQGEHDISNSAIPPELKASMAAQGAQLLSDVGGGTLYVKMNTTLAPFDDVNCRRAMAANFDYEMAVNSIAITEGVSQGARATGAISAGLVGHKDGEPLAKDSAAAQAFLAECKYDPADFVIEMAWSVEQASDERIALLMQANLAELGFRSDIRRIPWALLDELTQTPETTPGMSFIRQSAPAGDVDAALYGMYHSTTTPSWRSAEHLNDAEVDRLLDAGRVETDPAKREAIYLELNDLLLSLAPSIYVYDTVNVYAASSRILPLRIGDPAEAYSLSGRWRSFREIEILD